MPLRLVMMGTGEFALPTFRALLDGRHPVVGLGTQPPRTGPGRHRRTRNVMQELAEVYSIPVLQPEDIKKPAAIQSVSDLGPDLLVVAAYGQILPEALLDAVPLGGINLHGSLLPHYRGAAPVAWAIYHGESRTGVTVIEMKARVDAGPILACREVEIGPTETAGELEARLAKIGAPLVRETVDRLEAGTLEPRPQDPAQATRAPKLRKEHGVVDWSRPAGKIADQVRAMNPWPTAFTFWFRPGKQPVRLIVLEAQAVDSGGHSAETADKGDPGTIVTAGEGRLEVQTGSGWLALLKVQPAGKRAMNAEEFLRGYALRPGDRLGPADS